MFERRNEPDTFGNPGLQDTLRDALLERGGQVILFGDTGVGKSSLLRYAAEDEKLKVVVVECLSSKSYNDLIDDGLRKLVDVREVRRTRSAELSTEAEAGSKVPFLLSFKAKVKAGFEQDREFEVVEAPPLDALLQAMNHAQVDLFVLDNFQNIDSESTRLLIAQTMEFLSDRASESTNIKAVVIGIADDAASLVGKSGSFLRRVSQIGVPRMPDSEIRSIFVKGFKILDIAIDHNSLDRLIFYCDGFPYFAHLLGLNLARWARRASSETIKMADLAPALRRAVQEVDASFDDRIAKAFEAGGEVQPRKNVLNILARSDQREWTSSQVIKAWEVVHGRRSSYEFLHTALAALLNENRGGILKRKGDRTRYVYQFRDPYMRPYLRVAAVDGWS